MWPLLRTKIIKHLRPGRLAQWYFSAYISDLAINPLDEIFNLAKETACDENIGCAPFASKKHSYEVQRKVAL
jgi:hypothetical protein